MGNIGARLAIRFDQSVVCAENSSKLTGTVYLAVTKDKVFCKTLSVHFRGEESTSIVYYETVYDEYVEVTTYDNGEQRRETKYKSRLERREATSFQYIFAHKYILAKFPADYVAKGQYEFPFEVEVPNNLESSLYYTKNSDATASIRYFFEAKLARPGYTTVDVQNEVPVFVKWVSSRIPKIIEFAPFNQDIRFLWCIPHGEIIMTLSVDRDIISSGNALTVSFAFKNNTTATINSIKISARQRIYFQAGIKEHTDNMHLSDVVFAGASIPGTEKLEKRRRKCPLLLTLKSLRRA